MSVEPRIAEDRRPSWRWPRCITARAGACRATPAVAKRRDEAFALFERRGLPHRRVEAWKYTDLRALMRHAQPLVRASVAAAPAAGDALPGLGRYRLAIVDGRFVAGWSDRKALLAEGVEVTTLAEFLADDARAVELLDPPAGTGDDAMLALNAAMAGDGVVIRVPDGVSVSKPVESCISPRARSLPPGSRGTLSSSARTPRSGSS